MDSCCHFIDVDILVVVRIGFANVIVETIPLFVLDICKEKIVAATHLKTNHTYSCGCLKQSQYEKRLKIG